MLGDTEEMVERRYGKHSPDYLRSATSALKKPPRKGTVWVTPLRDRR